MMIHGLFLLLLPIAAISGWFVALRQSERKPPPLSRDYITGLTFLLNEEPDKAIDVFVKMLENDSEAIEIHLALGNLFRRRGEVDRSTRIHQNLIARPTLKKADRAQALLALAMDYLSAGVLDRAEELFKELLKSGEYVLTCLQQLLNIYEQEKEWSNAIKIARRLSHMTPDDISLIIAHYHCELAELAIEQQQWDQAIKATKRALSINKTCARASLLCAQVETEKKRYRRAIRHLQRIKIQNPEFLSEAILPLVHTYQALDEERELIPYFKKILKEFPKIPIAIMLSEQIRQWRGDKVAADFVADYVRKHPSIQGLHRLVELHLPLTEGKAQNDLTILHRLTQKLVTEIYSYRCTHCGFACNTLHWQCPRCKQWSKIKPTHVLSQD